MTLFGIMGLEGVLIILAAIYFATNRDQIQRPGMSLAMLQARELVQKQEII